NANRELLAAVAAVIPALAHGALGRQRLDRVHLSAEGAERAIGPALRLKVFAGGVLVVEDGVGDVAHRFGSFPLDVGNRACSVKYRIARTLPPRPRAPRQAEATRGPIGVGWLQA